MYETNNLFNNVLDVLFHYFLPSFEYLHNLMLKGGPVFVGTLFQVPFDSFLKIEVLSIQLILKGVEQVGV